MASVSARRMSSASSACDGSEHDDGGRRAQGAERPRRDAGLRRRHGGVLIATCRPRWRQDELSSWWGQWSSGGGRRGGRGHGARVRRGGGVWSSRSCDRPKSGSAPGPWVGRRAGAGVLFGHHHADGDGRPGRHQCRGTGQQPEAGVGAPPGLGRVRRGAGSHRPSRDRHRSHAEAAARSIGPCRVPCGYDCDDPGVGVALGAGASMPGVRATRRRVGFGRHPFTLRKGTYAGMTPGPGSVRCTRH
jgi:hypothetical protein